MLSKSQNKYIRSLAQQKYRNEHKVFIAEGTKIAGEWLASDAPVKIIIGTEHWANANKQLIARHEDAELHIVKDFELETLSTQQSPDQVMLVVTAPLPGPIPKITEWCLALDNIRDPGNLGTIIRVADWFGIKQIICSPGCAGAYSPKVIRAAMGGHLRVQIYEAELEVFLKDVDIPVIAATLEGENVYKMTHPNAAVIIIGNESTGIAPELVKLATTEVMIPRTGGAESLNAAVSAGILCALLMQ